MIKRSLSILCVFVCLAAAACSGGGEESSNQNVNAASSSASEFTDANVALAEGTKFLDTGEIDKAIDVLSRAVELNPELAEGWFKLGIAYALAEKRDETLAIDNSNTAEPEPTEKTKKVVKPNSEKAFEKAASAYKKLIDANDQDDAAHFNLGRAYNKLNKDEDAAKALKQAVKLKPDDTEFQT